MAGQLSTLHSSMFTASISYSWGWTNFVSELDKPIDMKFAALNLPDPETPVGARGIGEPPVGAGYGAVMNAIAAAVGDEVFRRTPVTPDVILMAIEHNGQRQHEALTAHI